MSEFQIFPNMVITTCTAGANSFLPENKTIPDNSLVMGSPGKVVRTLSPEEVNALKGGAQHYVDNAHRFAQDLRQL